MLSTSLFGGFSASGGGISLPETPPVPASCPANAKAAYDTLRDLISQLSQLHERLLVSAAQGGFIRLQNDFRGVENAYKTALNTFSHVRAGSSGVSLCQELCTAANTLQETLTASTLDREFDRVQKELENFKRDADSINSKINDFIASFPDCHPREGGLSVLRQVQFAIQSAATEATNALEEIKRMREVNKEFIKMRENIETIRSRPELLQEQRTIGPFDVPTNVVVRLEFKSIDAKESDPFREISKAELNFGGGPRFSVSVGLAVGLLERPEFKPIIGFERDIQGEVIPGQTVPTTIIELTDQARRRVTPILMLNTRLTNLKDYNLFMSVGITGSADSTGTNIEYLFGPSLNFLDGRLFVTGGVYGGRVQRLNPNQFVGLKVPDSTTAEKLVSKDFVWKTGFAVTYKIR